MWSAKDIFKIWTDLHQSRRCHCPVAKVGCSTPVPLQPSSPALSIFPLFLLFLLFLLQQKRSAQNRDPSAPHTSSPARFSPLKSWAIISKISFRPFFVFKRQLKVISLSNQQQLEFLCQDFSRILRLGLLSAFLLSWLSPTPCVPVWKQSCYVLISKHSFLLRELPNIINRGIFIVQPNLIHTSQEQERSRILLCNLIFFGKRALYLA